MEYAGEYGRDTTRFGVTVRMPVTAGGPDDWIRDARQLQAMGVTEIGVWTPDLQGEAALRRLIEARQVLAAVLGEQPTPSAARIGM
jgi:hypothetical protein